MPAKALVRPTVSAQCQRQIPPERNHQVPETLPILVQWEGVATVAVNRPDATVDLALTESGAPCSSCRRATC